MVASEEADPALNLLVWLLANTTWIWICAAIVVTVLMLALWSLAYGHQLRQQMLDEE